PAAGSFNVTSTRSGAGTWHLYALDDITGSQGLKNYQVVLNGTIPVITHRSPTTGWNDVDETGPFSAGFNDLRSGANVNPIVAGQGLANNPQIAGLGQTASNFTAKIPQAA